MALELDPNYVFRDFETHGLPSSGTWDPRKPEIRRLLTEWWQTLIALVGDAAGLELPNLLINMSVTGGNENNIEADANLPVPSGPGLALFSILTEEANTGPVRVNGKRLLTNSGNELPAGGLVEGGLYLFLDNGDSYRLMSDYASATLVAAAEQAVTDAESQVSLASDAADRSETARDIAAGFASDIVSQGNVPIYATVVGMPSLEVKQGILRARLSGYASATSIGQSAEYIRVSTEPTTARGKFRSADRYLPDGSEDAVNGGWFAYADPVINVRAFGALGDGSADDTVPCQAALDYAAIAKLPVHFPTGIYMVDPLVVKAGVLVYGDGPFATIIRLRVQASFPGAFGHNAPLSNEVIVPAEFGGSGARDSGIIIRDLCCDGNSANQTASGGAETEGLAFKGVEDCLIENVRVVNVLSDGIDLDYSDRVTIRTVTIDNCGKGGIHLSVGSPQGVNMGCNDILVDGAFISNCAGCAVNDNYIGGRGLRNIVRNITAMDCGQEGGFIGTVARMGRDGVSENITIIRPTQSGFGTGDLGTTQGDGQVVNNVTVIDAGSNGFRFIGDGLSISNITSRNAGGLGILFEQCAGLTISNLLSEGSLGDGLRFSNCNGLTTTSAIVKGAGASGLIVAGTNSSISLSGFQVDGAVDGILIGGTTTGVEINGYKCKGVSGRGIYLNGTVSKTRINGFDIDLCGGVGVHISSVSSGIDILEGTINSPGSHGVVMAGTSDDCKIRSVKMKNVNGYGVHINTRSNSEVDGCDIDGCTRGIYLQGAASNNKITNNKVRGATEHGVNVGGSASGNWVAFNDLKGATGVAANELVSGGTNDFLNNRLTA